MDCPMCENIAQIHSDPFLIAELETGYAKLGWHQRFPGYTVFVCKRHAVELHELPAPFRTRFLEEMALVSEAVFRACHADKMNEELLGNGTTHLHWHIFPRHNGDTPRPGPVWWVPPDEYFDDANRPDEHTRDEAITRIGAEIARLRAAERA